MSLRWGVRVRIDRGFVEVEEGGVRTKNEVKGGVVEVGMLCRERIRVIVVFVNWGRVEGVLRAVLVSVLCNSCLALR